MLNGWNHYIGLEKWCLLASREFKGWERDNNGQLYSIIITCKQGDFNGSLGIAREIDDLITDDFYYRDYTDSGLPYVRDGENYTSKFWFKKQIDFYMFQLFLKEKEFINEVKVNI